MIDNNGSNIYVVYMYIPFESLLSKPHPEQLYKKTPKVEMHFLFSFSACSIPVLLLGKLGFGKAFQILHPIIQLN